MLYIVVSCICLAVLLYCSLWLASLLLPTLRLRERTLRDSLNKSRRSRLLKEPKQKNHWPLWRRS